MHSHIDKLYKIANKPKRIIVGLMSGTSLDGLDVAVCDISGCGTATKCEVKRFITLDYDDDFRSKVKTVFAKSHGSIETLCLLNAWIGEQHAMLVNKALQIFGLSASSVDIVASHGQTIYHCPKSQHQIEAYPNATLQIGDGDHIAVKTGIITVSDFRQKHIAAGGEGAPLVMYGDYLLFNCPSEHRMLLNMGGIANLTFIPQNASFSHIFSSDVGPGNTMMDAYIQQHFVGQYYDKNAQLASKGEVNKHLLDELLSSSFLFQDAPKTTGPEVFNLSYLAACKKQAKCETLNHADTMATLCDFSASAISDFIARHTKGLMNVHVYTSGGGVHNPLLMTKIKQKLSVLNTNITMQSIGKLGINPDAKEAVLFALLANETLCSDSEFLKKASDHPHVTLGKISFPD
ncbi:anhydro-N-acetylmuramic acid kinase [Alteromonas oceanisediminis]|uniref:anhydro-N-acetylmuramic acid kinase n=1 Tax=Alteromonas oceanisediminis TaxID=2836180 RepID=UPI001BDB072D|nr:anhydro-N-acetylmuramic acid kinase [Alteromonas oceanisediminis]MBT0587661.1 anhydro-N-acetylmuramic acid kinase [Alteromonas oceanisediminis]